MSTATGVGAQADLIAVLRALDRAALAPMLAPEHRSQLAGPTALAVAGAGLSREQQITALRALHASSDVLAAPLAHMGVTLPPMPEPVTRAPSGVGFRPAVMQGADGKILIGYTDDEPDAGRQFFALRELLKVLPGAEVVPVAVRNRGTGAGKNPATGRPRRFHPVWMFPGSPAAAATVVHALSPYDPRVTSGVRGLADAHYARKAARELLEDGADLPDDRDGTDEVTMPLWTHQRRAVAFGEASPASLFAIKMGGGKTAAVIALVNRLQATSVLIVSPNRVRPVWPREVRERSVAQWHIEDGTRAAKRKGARRQDLSLAERLARAQFLWNDCDCGAPVHAFVLNYEAMVHPCWQEWVPERKLDVIVYDEGHRLKSPHTKPSASGRRIGRHERALGPDASDAQRREARRLDNIGPAEQQMIDSHAAAGTKPSKAMLVQARAQDKLSKAAEDDERSKRLSVSGVALRWVEFSDRRVALSGTPFPQHPWDIFGLYRALDPGVFGIVWEPFRDKYLQMNKTGQFPVRVKRHELTEFAAKATSLMYRPAVDLQLPEVQDVERVVELEPDARRAYDEFDAELFTDLRRWLTGERDAEHEQDGALTTDEEGRAEYSGTTTLSERNILTRLLRLQQLTGGTLRTDDTTADNGRRIPGAEVRISTVKADQLAEFDGSALVGGDLYEVGCTPGRRDADGKPIAPEPVVVFCRFRSDLDAVKAVTRKAKLRYGEISGRTSTGLGPDARMAPDVDVCAVQIQAGGTGVDLTRAAVGIWYSLGYSVSDYDQARARLHRPGQTRPVTYIHYVAADTKDAAVYQAIRMRKAAVSEVLRAGGVDPAAIGMDYAAPGPDPNGSAVGGITNARSAVPLPWTTDETDRR